MRACCCGGGPAPGEPRRPGVVRGGTDTRAAEATLRDELVALARESAELSWRELRRGVDALDSYTRPIDTPRSDAPRRPYRVKS